MGRNVQFIPGWLEAPSVADAPHSDALLYSQLHQHRHKDVDGEVAAVALKVAQGNFEEGSNKVAVIADEVPLSLANLIERTPGSCSRCLISRATGSTGTSKRRHCAEYVNMCLSVMSL